MTIVEKAVDRMGGRPERKREPGQMANGQPLGRIHSGDAGDRTSIVVDRERLREAGFLAPEEYERRLAEEYRRIKRPLLAHAFGIGATRVEAGNLIMIASALSGEGKTHTCINLALSMAMEKDRTVLLVDGDVAKPTISQVFGVEGQPGLLDVLEGAELNDVLMHTDIPGLRLLPAGRPREGATELLASDRMRALADELSERYPDRVILFDSPPLLATSESQAIAAAVGQVALVVASGTTRRSVVKDALEHLRPELAVNIILNKQRYVTGDGYYGGYYGGYGYGNERTGGDEAEPT
jgi:receptor protein-tyrosine kinase